MASIVKRKKIVKCMITYVLVQCFVSIIMEGLKVTIYEWFLFYVVSRLTWIIILWMNYCVLSKLEGFTWVVH